MDHARDQPTPPASQVAVIPVPAVFPRWEAKVREKTRAEEFAGIADVDGDCVLVTWEPLLVWIDRATGEVSRRRALR